MSDEDHADHGHDVEGLERVTAPQQAYSMRQVWTGLLVLAVGLAVTVGVPLLLG